MENRDSIITRIGVLSETQTSFSKMTLLNSEFTTNLQEITSSGSYLLAICENNSISSLTGRLSPYISNVFQLINHQNIKEEFYITAISNLIKKNEFLQLSIQLDQDTITEEEFNSELDENEDKYLIRINQDFTHDYFRYITEILPKLNRNFSSDEVSEMFSVPIEDVNLYLDSILAEANKV